MIAESVTNIVKYAGATTVDVSVEADDEAVTVRVGDDGCGGADPGSGTGLRGLRDRVGRARRDAGGRQPGRRGHERRRQDPAGAAARADALPISRLGHVSAQTGAVAFLLCDIEGSTRLVHEAGPDYPAILTAVRRILRDAVTRHAGSVIDTHGDELFAAFASLETRSRPPSTASTR